MQGRSHSLSMAMTASLLSLMACGIVPSSGDGGARLASAWQPIESPLKLGWDYKTDFSILPLSASLEKEPWADDYWADSQGGISRRVGNVSSGVPGPGELTEELVRRLSPRDLAALSPAEKLDIILGNFTFPTVAHEKRRVNRPGITGWEGLCHGWANAALNFTEPKAISFTTAQGIELPLGSSDLKAMLTWLTAESNGKRRSIGKTCPYNASAPEYQTFPDCRDVHAGAFHIILANQLGFLKRGIVIDKVPDLPVWNHPIYGYRSSLAETRAPSEGAATDAVKEVVVNTELDMEAELSPQWSSGAHRPIHETLTYTLELNVNDEIVGGRWLSSARPDTVWMWDAVSLETAAPEFARAYRQAIAAPADATPIR